MAMTQEYMDYLNEQVGIAPANSQEELQAAQLIAGVMEAHGLSTMTEEFDAPAWAGLTEQLLNVVMLVGVVLAGAGSLAGAGLLTFIGFVLAAVPCALALLRLFGREVSLDFGPKARSQNVVALHRASGPLVAKGSRPIVVVAHYDTPHENVLFSSPVASQIPLIAKASRWAVYVTAVGAFVQVMGFIPAPGRIFFWVVALVACVPGVVLAVGAVSERVSTCTLGANDNKASVAAMLGVLENVRPTGSTGRVVEPSVDAPFVPAPDASGELAADLDGDLEPAAEGDLLGETVLSAPGDAAFAEPRLVPAEEVLGVRHGEKVVRALGILPEGCEIEYVEPALVPVAPAPAPAAPAPAPASATATLEMLPVEEADVVVDAEPAGTTAPVEPLAASAAEPAATRESLTQTGRFSLVMDGDESEGVGVGPQDSSGLTALDDETRALTEPVEPAAARPEAPSDPDWGKSSYRPQLSPVARRASLFDLPDPGENAQDPFGKDLGATRVVPAQQQPARVAAMSGFDAPAAQVDAPVAVPPTVPAPEPVAAPAADLRDAQMPALEQEPLEVLPAEDDEPKRGLKGFFSRFGKGKKKSEADSGADDGWLGDDEDDGFGSWRGGAATRSGLRLVEDDEELPAEAPTDEDLRDAVLGMGDDALIAHDIWFVALGASALDHAGMKAFLHAHRSDIRGCFLVNLDCVGSGALTALSHEGLADTRRADRRLVRQIVNTAADLHVDLATKTHDWASTDATPAMKASRRSVTLMGLGTDGLPALSRTSLDVVENVDAQRVANVAAIVTEMIRRA